jgi:S1-C subfamily serine protease
MKFVDDIETGRRDDLAQIEEVIVGSPASKAGLRKDDILRTWDGRTISGPATWKSLMKDVKIGQTVQFGVIRAGHKMNVPVTLEGTTRTKSGPHRVNTSTAASSEAH